MRAKGSDNNDDNKNGQCYLSTVGIICLVLFFVVAIMATAGITYAITSDSYYFAFFGNLNEEGSSKFERNSLGQKSTFPKLFAEGDDIRLPSNLVPKKYLVMLQPFLDESVNYTVTGYEEMTFEVDSATNQIIFHILDINIDTSSLQLEFIDTTDPGLQFFNFTHDVDRQFYIITLTGDLEAGSEYRLKMNFTAYLNDNLIGFYRSVYEDETGTERMLGTTQFEATEARRAFPCMDEPAMKASFDIRILRQGTELRSISNMPRIDTYEAAAPWEGWYWDIFQVSLPMSTYLVAFIVSDFAFNSSDENDHVTFRVWAREEALYQADYALDIGPEVLTFFEDYFSIPFPLPKQDMVALPDFDAGAMENWGLITYRETALLYDPRLGSASNKQRVGVVVAHELAHQWFGDLVSPSWWTYLWLNEGFASYMEHVALDAVEPSFDMLDQFILNSNQYAFSIDSLENSHPITIEVTDTDEIWEIFDAISYNKGASIIRMMEFFLTTDTFRKGLTNYLTELQYQSATQDDLWRYLSDQAHLDATLPLELTVKQIMDTWTLQMGYPVVTVVRSQEGTSASITQERFLLVTNENSTDTNVYMWWIPITYATQANPDFDDTYPHVWMTKIDREIVINTPTTKDQWLILNTQLGGYYRVNYDAENWELIRLQLFADYEVIALANRAQIIDDALDLARAGLLNYNTALDINAYMEFETNYVPWSASLDNLDYIEQMFTATAGYGGIKDYLLTLLIPLYDLVGFEDDMTDPHLDQLKRALALSWACFLEYEPCVDSATALYQQWMITPDDLFLISPNTKSTVYCAGVANGGEEEWDFAYEMFLSSNLGSDKDYLMSAMGCSKEQWILERYLDMGFTEEFGIRKQDSYKVFGAVASNDIGNRLAWDYLVANWDDLADYYGSDVVCADYANTAAREFNTESELAEVVALREAHLDDLGGATQSIDQVIETIQNNIKWVDNYYEQIHQWMLDNGYGDSIGP